MLDDRNEERDVGRPPVEGEEQVDFFDASYSTTDPIDPPDSIDPTDPTDSAV